MKLIKWETFDNIEAYTVTREMGDMSLNNNPTQALENRKELAKLLNTDLKHMVAPRQTHTTNFKEVSLKDGGTNMTQQTDIFKDTDALYTKDPDLFLLSFHADCTPVLVYCKDTNIVCAIHSGWLGTVKQIVTRVIKHLIDNENCDPKQMYCYIGPCISYEHLEVQDDVIDKVKMMDFDTTPYYKKTDNTHYILDNKGLNKQQLLNLGVLESNITISPYCTVNDNELFFSHRKNRDGQRNITIIKRKK